MVDQVRVVVDPEKPSSQLVPVAGGTLGYRVSQLVLSSRPDGGGVIFHCGAEPMWGHLGPLRSRLKLGRGSGGARARFRAGPPCNVRGLGSR